MQRLTVHLDQPIFREMTQTNVGTKEAPKMKPKKRKCIQNTLSFKNVTQEDVKHILHRIRKTHGIAVWEKGDRKGEEMIYLVY